MLAHACMRVLTFRRNLIKTSELCDPDTVQQYSRTRMAQNLRSRVGRQCFRESNSWERGGLKVEERVSPPHRVYRVLFPFPAATDGRLAQHHDLAGKVVAERNPGHSVSLKIGFTRINQCSCVRSDV